MIRTTPRGMLAAVADALRNGPPKSIAQRRHELDEDEATAATLGVETADLPERPLVLPIEVCMIDDEGRRTRIAAAPDAVDRFWAIVDQLPDPDDADAWGRRADSGGDFLEAAP